MPGDRVGNAPSGAPSSHTTVRTVPYTAVRSGHCSRRCSSIRLRRPRWRKKRAGTAWPIWDAAAFHHGPCPLYAEVKALWRSSPSCMSRFARVRGRFHCRHRMQRSLRRSHWSRCSNAALTSAIRKYATHPRMSGVSRAIVHHRLRPRPCRASSRTLSRNRFTDSGATRSVGAAWAVIV